MMYGLLLYNSHANVCVNMMKVSASYRNRDKSAAVIY